MALDILNPTIHKNTKVKGGYCVVDESLIDNENYLEIDASVFGLELNYWEQMATTTLYNSYDASTDYWNGGLWTFGGNDGGTFSNTLIRYDIATDSYIEVTLNDIGDGIISPRALSFGQIVNGYFYIYGGYNGSVINQFWSIELATGNCKDLKIWGSSLEHDCAVIGDILYLHAGWNKNNTRNLLYTYDTTGDPDTTNWVAKQPGGTYKYDHRIVALNGYIYSYGGRTAGGTYLNEFIRYDPVTDTWTTLTPGPLRVNDHSMVAYKNKLYWGGGTASSGDTRQYWSYEPVENGDSNNWKIISSPTPIRFGFCSGYGIDGWLYLQYRDTVWRLKVSDIMAIRLPRGL